MGIHRQTAKLILAEHKYRPISGQALMCGKQSVHLGDSELTTLLTNAGIAGRDRSIAVDRATRGARNDARGLMTDDSFFRRFSDATVRSIDVMEEEGADIIHDLCQPIPAELENAFDFIYDGGTLDNVFDPVTVLKNTARMLRPGGRIVHMNMGSFTYKAYLMFSADWFHDFYAINQFADCKVYVAVFDRDMHDAFMDLYVLVPWEFSRLCGEGSLKVSGLQRTPASDFTGVKSLIRSALRPLVPRDSRFYDRIKALFSGTKEFLVLAVAEKGAESTWDKNPIQDQYRPKEFDEEFRIAIGRFFASPRPIIDTGVRRRRYFSDLSAEVYRYCGSDF